MVVETPSVASHQLVTGKRVKQLPGVQNVSRIETQAGTIPEDWDAIQLGDLFLFKNGLNKSKEYFGWGTPIINYMDVFRRPWIRFSGLQGRVSLSHREIERYSVQKGDVFFTRTSETAAEVGTASVLLDNAPNTVFSGFVLRARPKNSLLDNDFKKYCFASKKVRDQIVSTTIETTRALTSGRILSRVWIARPPIDEQRAIASVLSDADALIESLARLIAKKRAVKLAVMHQLLTGKMRVPGFNESWQVLNLGSILTFPKHASNPRADLGISGSVHYVHYGDVHSHETPVLDCRREALPLIEESKVAGVPRLRDGDLVLADASEDLIGIGKSVELQDTRGRAVVAGLHTIVARGEETDWATRFKAYLQFIPKFKRALERAASGISVYAISKRNVAEISLPLPPVEEQQAIVKILSDMEEEAVALQRRLGKVKELKQGMMQVLLTGKVRLVPPEVNA